MRWLKVIKINSDKECMIAIFSFLLFLLYMFKSNKCTTYNFR